MLCAPYMHVVGTSAGISTAAGLSRADSTASPVGNAQLMAEVQGDDELLGRRRAQSPQRDPGHAAASYA